MPTEKEKMVSRHAFSVAYNGDGREDNHSIEVEALAPALIAFGKLIREANTEINGKKAIANVKVVSDFEHKCFQINFELALSFFEQVKILIGADDVVAAKTILEWLGLISTGTVGTLSYLGYLKWKRGRAASDIRVSDQDGSGNITVTIAGDKNPVVVNHHVYRLSTNPKALKATRDAFLPVGRDGFDRLEIHEDSHVVDVIDSNEIRDILSSCTTGVVEADEDIEPDVSVTPAWLSVYSPVYDSEAKNWEFRYGNEIIEVDITSTGIAADTVARGVAPMNDSYQVRLEVTTTPVKEGSRAKPRRTYKILEVVTFIPAPPATIQLQLFPTKGED